MAHAQSGIPLSTVAGGLADVRSLEYPGQGGFLSLVWAHEGGSEDHHLKWRLFSGASALNDVLPVDGQPLVTRPGYQQDPRVARTGPIGCAPGSPCPSAVVCYTEWQGQSPRVRAHRFGDALEWDMAVTEADSLGRFGRIVGDGGTGAIVCWAEGMMGWPRAQRLSGDGTLQWGPQGVAVVTPPIATYEMQTAADGAGGVFAVWTDLRNDPDRAVAAMHLAADGSPAPGWPAAGSVIRTGSNFPDAPDILPDGAGGAFILWHEDESLPIGQAQQPRLIRIHPDGSIYT